MTTKEYKVVYNSLNVKYNEDELVSFLQLKPDIFEEVKKVANSKVISGLKQKGYQSV